MSNLQRIIFTISILTITGASIVFFVIYPTIKDIGTLNDRIQIERLALENKYTGRRNIKNIIADLKYVNDELTKLDNKIIINKDNVVMFLSLLEEIAKSNNLVQDIKITPTSDETIKFTQKYSLLISLAGDYVDVLKYIEKIEQSELYIIVKNINISSAKIKNTPDIISSGAVKTNLEGYVYFYN